MPWPALDRLLHTDAEDVGCEETLRLLDVYADLISADPTGIRAARHHPGVAAHLRACNPCAEDLRGLLLAIRDAGGPDRG